MNNIDFLLLSDSKDFTTDYVSLEMEQRGLRYLRLDRDLLPKYSITWNINDLQLFITKNSKLFFINSSLKGVYYRAPTYLRETFSKNKTVEQQLKQSQWMSFYRNLLCFNNARWMNSPSDTFYAENKIIQLNEAKKIGFRIPKTILANSAEKILFDHNSMIVKSLDTAIFNLGKTEAFVYTNSINLQELKDAELSISPVIIQENLSPKIDYRVTVVGDKVFSVQILNNGQGVDGDWRKEKDDVNFIPTDLPDEINDLCCMIIKNLGLAFGAIDLIYCKNEFYFIEVNPTGEWAWLVDSANQKIYEAICDYLTN